MIRRYLILSVFSASLLSGCSFIMPTRHAPEMAQAQTLIQNGKNKEAASIYKQLADAKSDEQNHYRLLTADAFIRANDVKQAKHYLSLVEVNALNEEQSNHLTLLQAQIELSQGNAEVALAKLNAVQSEALNNQTKIAYYQSLAFAYSLTGNPLQSAQTLINSESLIQSSQQRNKHYGQILSTLDEMSEEDLHIKQPLSNPVLSGWMALARVFKMDEESRTENLAKWKQKYPSHPANSAFLTDYVKNYHQNLAKAPLIAVFLPESGAYAAPAAVIKKGFMKAYKLAKKNGSTNTEIRFYDSATKNIDKLYQQAISDGAKLVVGPLDKKDIKTLMTSADLTIPVLALNHVEGLSSPKLYQYALSPIDDAEQITQKARADGRQNALFLVPKSEQGKRFAGYLTDNWQKLGGNTVDTQVYDDSKSDFAKTTQAIAKQATDENSVDALIINAYAKPARALYPQLHKNKATAQLPVYATSQIYIGDNDAKRDKELDGVTFCDVPWVFPTYEGELSKDDLRSSWQDLSPSYLRLLPMGIDAYNVIEHLNHLKTQPYNGATGKLKLDGENRITRELQCAKFVNGVPKMTDGAAENADSSATETQPEPATTANKKRKPAALPDLPNFDETPNSKR